MNYFYFIFFSWLFNTTLLLDYLFHLLLFNIILNPLLFYVLFIRLNWRILFIRLNWRLNWRIKLLSVLFQVWIYFNRIFLTAFVSGSYYCKTLLFYSTSFYFGFGYYFGIFDLSVSPPFFEIPANAFETSYRFSGTTSLTSSIIFVVVFWMNSLKLRTNFSSSLLNHDLVYYLSHTFHITTL